MITFLDLAQEVMNQRERSCFGIAGELAAGARNGVAMSDLECNHCGDFAFTSRDYRDGVYWFTDGDGEECATCGFPGWVSVDEPDPDDASVSWVCSDANDAVCDRPDCEECAEIRASFGLPALATGSPVRGGAGPEKETEK